MHENEFWWRFKAESNKYSDVEKSGTLSKKCDDKILHYLAQK